MVKGVQDIKTNNAAPSLKMVRNEMWYLLHSNNAFFPSYTYIMTTEAISCMVVMKMYFNMLHVLLIVGSSCICVCAVRWQLCGSRESAFIARCSVRNFTVASTESWIQTNPHIIRQQWWAQSTTDKVCTFIISYPINNF